MHSFSLLFEDMLQHIGWGRYQIKNTAIAVVMATFMSVQVLSPIFISYTLPHQCISKAGKEAIKECNKSFTIQENMNIFTDVDNIATDHCKPYPLSGNAQFNCTLLSNETLVNNNTGKKEPCEDYLFFTDGSVKTSIAVDFTMVCDRAWLNYLLQSVFMIGVFLNGLILGKVSDRIGRKNILLFMAVCTVVVALAIAFVTSLPIYIFLRGLVGFVCFVSPTTYVLVAETTIPQKRSMVVQLSSFGFSIGTMLLPILAYFIRTWKELQIASACLYIITIIMWWFIDESPRWLISRGRITEARNNLLKIAKFNNVCTDAIEPLNRINFSDAACSNKTETVLLENTKSVEEHSTSVKDNQDQNPGMTDTLRTNNLRILTMVLTYCWFATSSAFYGLTLNAANIGGDVYLTTFLMGILAVPAYVLSIYLSNKIGRRIVIAVSFVIAGIFCTSMYFIPKDIKWLQTTVFMIGRMGTLVPFSTLFLYTIELYPTILRSTAVNYGNAIARLGAAVAPAISMLKLVQPPLPYFTFGLITLAAGVLILLLPETKNAPLCETLQEADNFVEKNPGPFLRLFRYNCCKHA